MFDVKDKRVQLRKLNEELTDEQLKYEYDMKAIKTTILNTSDLTKLKDYIPELVMATWNENIDEFNKSLTDLDREKFVFRTLQGKFIPTALDSISVTFKLEGITWHDVSHLIRHQQFKFAADCSGDKIIEDRVIAVPEFVNDLNLFKEYDDAMRALIKLYRKAINRNVHIQDARLMLPRTMTTFYYVTGSLGACIKFITQRIDRQVQPKSDNVVAMQLLLELCKILPALACIISPNMPNSFYIKETQTNFASKWESPLLQNELALKNIELKDDMFVYGNKHRDELPGNKSFVKLWNKYLAELKNISDEYYKTHSEIVNDCITGDWK